MARDEGGDVLAFLTGFVVGGLVGAGVTLLLAPQSGAETREQIRAKSVEVKGRAEEEIAKTRERAEQTLEEARLKAEAVAADLRRRADDVQAQGRKVLEEGRKQLVTAVEQTRKAAGEVKTPPPAEEAPAEAAG